MAPGPLGDEVLPVVDEKAQVAFLALERGDREVRLAQGGPGDGESVNRVALAGLAGAAPGPGHELGRDADDRLARAQQIPRQAPGQVAAVLEGEASLPVPAGPADKLKVPGGGCRDRDFGELPAGLVRGDRGMRALVRIDADDDRLLVAS